MFRSATLVDFLSWPAPNYDNPVRRGNELYYLSALFLSVATFCVALRLYTRIFVRRFFGIDDALLILGYIFSALVTALTAVGTHSFDWDRHIYDVRPELYSGSAEILYFSRTAWGLAASFTRLSVLAMYYRLLGACDAPRRFFWVCHVVTGASVVVMLYYLGSGVFPCWPIDAYWSWPTRPGDHCMDDLASLNGANITNTILEAAVATMPLVAIFKLRVGKAQRWNVISALSMGYIVAIAGILRTQYIFKITQTFDISWYAMPQWICSELENDLALIAACAAPLLPVIGRFFRRFRGLPATLPKVRKVSPFQNLSLTSSSTTTKRAITTYARDPESLAEWLTATSRTIDLEGIISTDGLGYSVTISGPTKADKKRAAREQISNNIAMSGLTGRRPVRNSSSDVKGGFDIQTKKEFDLSESYTSHDLSYASGWGATPGERGNRQQHQEKMQRCDEEDLENYFPEIREWAARNETSDDNSCDSSDLNLPIQHPG